LIRAAPAPSTNGLLRKDKHRCCFTLFPGRGFHHLDGAELDQFKGSGNQRQQSGHFMASQRQRQCNAHDGENRFSRERLPMIREIPLNRTIELIRFVSELIDRSIDGLSTAGERIYGGLLPHIEFLSLFSLFLLNRQVSCAQDQISGILLWHTAAKQRYGCCPDPVAGAGASARRRQLCGAYRHVRRYLPRNTYTRLIAVVMVIFE